MRGTVLMLMVCAVPLAAWAADGGAKAGIEAGNAPPATATAEKPAATPATSAQPAK